MMRKRFRPNMRANVFLKANQRKQLQVYRENTIMYMTRRCTYRKNYIAECRFESNTNVNDY